MARNEEFEHLESFVGMKLTDTRKMELLRGVPTRNTLLEIAKILYFIKEGIHPNNIYKSFEKLGM